MKKGVKIILFVFLTIFAFIIGFLLYVLIITADVKLDADKLNINKKTITYYDADDNVFATETCGQEFVSIDELPDYTINAFIAIEDKRFYSHNGVDYKALARSVLNNVKTMSFKEGASTISQQLIKNTHLSNEKTLLRKIKEIKLSKELERKYTKKAILETYLNTIYFGDNCYGIASASKHYFSVNAEDLTLNQSASLAATIKAPRYYSPTSVNSLCFSRKNIVLKEMLNQGYITNKEYEINASTAVPLNIGNNNDGTDTAIFLIKKEINDYLENIAYNGTDLTIKTTFDANCFEIINDTVLTDDEDCDKASLILSNNGEILSVGSTCGLQNRQMGSTIKPIAVYAPAIEKNLVYPCSFVLDEKTDFNGYKPKNYNDKYYGYVSVRDALAKSLNVCAVKLLKEADVDYCAGIVKKAGIPIVDDDKNLSLALGASKYGANLLEITAAYDVFLNKGFYVKPYCVDKIETSSGNVIYKHSVSKRKVISNDTAELLNHMNKYTVTNGTAKKLSLNNLPIAAKTGTVGVSDGNTDAYCISYSTDYILGVWYGSDDKLLSNDLTGGSTPAAQSAKIWDRLYENKKCEDFKTNDIEEILIDKVSYDEDRLVVVSDKNSPLRYTASEFFKKNYLPSQVSDRFSNPRLNSYEISVNNNEIIVKLCLSQFSCVQVYKEVDGKKNQILDTETNGEYILTDNEVASGKRYVYYVIPYFDNGTSKVFGREYILDTIKMPHDGGIDDWWDNEFD